MMRKPGIGIGWVLVLTTVFGALWVGFGDRLTTHLAYAVERGRIQASNDELAGVEGVANAFRLVAKIARPGVVQIRSSGATMDEDERRQLEKDLRERLGDDFDEDQLERMMRRFERRKRMQMGSGSGIVFDADGYILTNNHVVEDRERIEVILSNGRSHKATLVGADSKTDLAVIHIDETDLHALTFGDSDQMEVGDWVLAVGAPFGLTATVTHGIISAKGRTDVVRAGDIFYQNFLQTDAAINPGNSGGPLVNLRGEVVGVNTAIATNGDSYNAGVAFTIPSNMAIRIARQLRRHGEVARGWLGVTLSRLTDEELARLKLKRAGAIMVDAVYVDSAAEKAGVLCEDVILEINGEVATDISRMQGIIADILPGETARLTVLRDGREREVRVELARQPRDPRKWADEPERKLTLSRRVESLPLRVRTLRPQLSGTIQNSMRNLAPARRRALARRAGAQSASVGEGVFVVETSGSRAVGIEPGEVVVAVNNKPVASVAELLEAIKAGPNRKPLEFTVIGADDEPRVVRIKRK